MNWFLRTLLSCVVLVLLAAPAIPVHAQANGSIVGHVTNGTAGAARPADLEVVVHVLTNRVKSGEQRVRTDGTGTFRLEGLTTGAETLYFPILTYGGVPYYPEKPITLDGPTPASTEIAIYESTATPDAISFERLNMLVMGVSPTALTIMEMGAVVNAGDRTFAADASVTGSARTLRFALPQGAIDVTPQAGFQMDALEVTPDGFAATDPVRPGRREIAYSYELPYTSAALDLNRTFAFPAGTFTLYAPPEIGEVVGPGMAFRGAAELGGRTFRTYAVDGVKPDGEVRFRLTGLPAPLFARPRDLGLVVAGAAGVILLAALGWSVQRRVRHGPGEADESTADGGGVPAASGPRRARRVRRTATVGRGGEAALAANTGQASDVAVAERPATPASTEAVESAERAELIRSLARLDEQFAGGDLDEEAYKAERAEQKARLIALTRLVPDAS